MTKAEKILSKYPSVKLGLDDHYGKQTVLNAMNDFSSELIKDLGDTKRKFAIWHDGGEWIISLSGKEMTNSKPLKGWLLGNK